MCKATVDNHLSFPIILILNFISWSSLVVFAFRLLLASHFGNWYAESHQEVGLIADPTTFAHKDLIYAIPLGDDIREDTKIDGCVAFKNLNNLTLSVTFEHANSATNRSFDVLCYVKHFSSVSINSNDGRVSKSLST